MSMDLLDKTLSKQEDCEVKFTFPEEGNKKIILVAAWKGRPQRK